MTQHTSNEQPEVAAPLARRRSHRIVLALCALPVAGLLAAGCNSGHSTAASPPPAKATVASTNSGTTTSTTTPACSSTRDPFDPTDSPAPAGSSANC